MIERLNLGGAFIVVTEEALRDQDLAPLVAWLDDQEEWSDLPFILLTRSGGGLERNPAARRFLDTLGNVTFLERPFHPTTLVSLARSALRARRRQYDARSRLQELRENNETLESRVAQAIAERKVLADIVEGTDAYVQVADANYRWLAVNRAAAQEFERIFGVNPRIGQSMLDALSDWPEHQRDVERVWKRALAGEEFVEVAEFGDHTRDRRSYEMKFNVLRDRDGRQIGAYQFVYDVTDRLAADRRLAETEDALRQSQKMEAVGQLTGGVAHDFNNLLTIIKSSTDLLRRPSLPDERRIRYVDAISETVDRASKLTSQLLAFARRQSLKPETFDVNDRITSVVEMLRTLVGSRIEIETVLGDPQFIHADATQFETALINIAVNARDAMNGEGRLVVAVRALSVDKPHTDVAISVSDTGGGIAPETIAHIFDPFFTTKEVGKGTGLGLSQVYGFAKQSGGDVQVESELGRGTTFTILLPRANEADLKVDPAEQGEDAAAFDGTGRRVLVVEDNADVGTFSSQLLQDLGYKTKMVSNADEALALLAHEADFDIVFSDVVMPGMSGVDLGHEINRLYPRLPVVLTSGYSDVLAQEGPHGFELVKKPYSADELSRVLRRCLA
nr:ATP-binding protein [Variibacter gotjawalensis]